METHLSKVVRSGETNEKGVSAYTLREVSPALSHPSSSLPDQIGGRLSAIERDAYERGFASGERAGRELGLKQVEASHQLVARLIESLQKVVSREIDPVQPVVITFGKISGGVARNVIADRVILTGTARTLSPESARRIPALIRRTVAGVCRARGAKFEMLEIARYPVLRNHARVNRFFANNFDRLFGGGKIDTTEVVLGGEDFACYLEKVPGAMFRLGIRNMKIGADKPWHSDRFVADEQALRYGSALLAATAIDALKR